MQYLQWKNGRALETVDSLNPLDFSNYGEYSAERRRLKSEYAMTFGSGELYWSNRPCKNWSNN